MFLQEIAIFFIYYLFLGLLDLIDFGNEKHFIPYDIFHSSLLCTQEKWAVDNGQKLDSQAWKLLRVLQMWSKSEKHKNKKLLQDKKGQLLALTRHSFWASKSEKSDLKQSATRPKTPA